MLIILDSSLVTALTPEAVGFEAKRHYLEQALHGANGRHLVTGDHWTLAKLRLVPELSLMTRRILDRVASRVAQHYGYARQMAIVARLGDFDFDTPRSEVANSPRVIEIPLKWCNHPDRLRATALIGENLSDCGILEMMARASVALQARPRVPNLYYEAVPGGGSTLPELAELRAQTQLTLAVVDSDRRYPDAPRGDTSARTLHLIRTQVPPNQKWWQRPLLAAIETTGRDLENALPDSFFEKGYAVGDGLQCAKVLCGATKGGRHELRLFFDVKEGFRLRDIFRFDLGTPGRQFWSTELQFVEQYSGVSANVHPCAQAGACAQIANCQCRLFQGLGNSVLDSFSKNPNHRSPNQNAQVMHSPIQAEWERLGGEVTDWCCSENLVGVG